jgi:hypothetical protein
MNEQLQKMLDELPQKKYAKLSDRQLEGYEIQRNIPRNEEWRRKIGQKQKRKFVSEETRKKISEQSKKLKHSEETKEICRQKSIGLNVGRRHTQEAKDKLSKSKKGKKLSEEGRKKLSEAQKKRINHFNELAIKNRREKTLRPILCYSYPEMKFICEYESIIEASIKLKRDRGGIGKILNGTIKEPRKLTFKYKN